ELVHGRHGAHGTYFIITGCATISQIVPFRTIPVHHYQFSWVVDIARWYLIPKCKLYPVLSRQALNIPVTFVIYPRYHFLFRLGVIAISCRVTFQKLYAKMSVHIIRCTHSCLKEFRARTEWKSESCVPNFMHRTDYMTIITHPFMRRTQPED